MESKFWRLQPNKSAAGSIVHSSATPTSSPKNAPISVLLSDFMRDVYAADLRRLERTLSHRQWEAFLAECEHRDDAVGTWAETTRKKLFQVIVRMLVESKFLDTARRMSLTPPMLHPKVRAYLKRLGAKDTLARMEVKA